MKRPAKCRIPAAAGQILASARDYETALAKLTSLIVASGFADECVIETCSSAEQEDPSGEPVPRLDGWVSSVIHAPLVARGAVLGAVAFYRFEGGAPFGEQDREIAEAIAWCVALVVDTGQPVSRLDGAAVRRARQERGWTQARLAGELDRGDEQSPRSGERTQSGLRRRVAVGEASGDE